MVALVLLDCLFFLAEIKGAHLWKYTPKMLIKYNISARTFFHLMFFFFFCTCPLISTIVMV